MSILTEQEKKGEGRLEVLGVSVMKANGKVGNRRGVSGNGKVKVARMKISKLSVEQLEKYREIARKAMAEAKAGNINYMSNYR